MKFTKVRDVKSPVRGTKKSAGIDFFIPNDAFADLPERAAYIFPNEGIKIPSGVHVKIPEGFALIAMNKSGVATKKGLTVGASVVDEDYQGEIHLHVINTTAHVQRIQAGEKLVQMLLVPVSYLNAEEVETLEDLYGDEVTERGAGGFGSTGII